MNLNLKEKIGNYKSSDIIVYTRTLMNDQIIVVLNFSVNEMDYTLPGEIEYQGLQIMVSNYNNRAGSLTKI